MVNKPHVYFSRRFWRVMSDFDMRDPLTAEAHRWAGRRNKELAIAAIAASGAVIG